ncbi:MAG: diguanylate cyclase [Idiomarina sp.]
MNKAPFTQPYAQPFAQLAEYIDLLLDAVCVVDREHKFTYLSPGAKRIFGYEPEEMLGRSMFDFMHPDHHQDTRAVAERVNGGEDVTHFENRYIRKDGSVADLHWTARWSERDQMRVGVARDISVRKQLERERESLITRLETMALTDSLTQLPNRALFADRATLALARAERDGIGFGILYLDMDKFKQINDHYGHASGDDLLRAAAERLKSILRPTDTVARIGGDEFVVLCDTGSKVLDIKHSVQTVAEKIHLAMQQPLTLPRGQEVVSVSIGMAAWPEHGGTVDSLVQHADHAMYRAKHAGGNALSW